MGRHPPLIPVNLDPSPWNEPLIDPEKWVDVILPETSVDPVKCNAISYFYFM